MAARDASVPANTIGWTISDWAAAYRGGANPEALVYALMRALRGEDTAWITRTPDTLLRDQLEALGTKLQAVDGDIARLPLYGIPFAVKDNIDVAGLPTTAGCPSFAYVPTRSATVVQRLLDAGAIVVGKTNLDQFATGLVGVRSPYGAVPNTFDARYIAGGSSSGSASLVARGLVPFALGTDTAGSGRVPAGLNNIVGLKPTRGALSNTGVVPACRTLDCVSIFALTAIDAQTIYVVANGFDASDSYSRRAPTGVLVPLPARARIGTPRALEWFGDDPARACYEAALAKITDLGAEVVPIDFTVLHRVAALLYEGPWVAERYAAIESFVEKHAEEMHPVVRQIIEGAKRFLAADTFNAMYRLAELKREADQLMASVDVLIVPTAPTIFRITDVESDPIRLNTRLGTYTNFVNLLDWSALAVPAGFRTDGLPFGITFIGPAWQEHALAEFGARWQRHLALPLGATARHIEWPGQDVTFDTANTMKLAVVGAHLRGMPLNHELISHGARFVERTQTSNAYRLYALKNTTPPKPALVRTGEGAPIEVEVWDMPVAQFGRFVADIPAPLGIGTLELVGGRLIKGFICEPWAIAQAVDITEYGGWRAYLRAGQ